jgi:hypothetical protein
MWDVWWTKWQRNSLSPSLFGFLRGSIVIYHLGDEQQVRWWPQFTDIVSPDRHKQHEQSRMDQETHSMSNQSKANSEEQVTLKR